MLVHDHKGQDITALIAKSKAIDAKYIDARSILLTNSDVEEALTAVAGLMHACTDAPKRKLSAALRFANATHEILSIRQSRCLVLDLIRPAYFSHKDLLELVALDRCERLAKAVRKRAENYLMRTTWDEREVFFQNEPKSPHHLVHKTTQ